MPISEAFGFDRGTPIDRYYIEKFLSANADAICGVVLEFGDPRYTRRFGNGVTRSEVMHPEPGPEVTIVGNLEASDGNPVETFDCIVATQTLNHVFDLAAAVKTLLRALRPGGTLLVTVPGITRVSEFDATRWGDFWRFTPSALERLLQAESSTVTCTAHGNVLSATAFLYGLAAEELDEAELAIDDARYPLVVTARARRRPEGPAT
jgi:SAM-dependent methyltransferase